MLIDTAEGEGEISYANHKKGAENSSFSSFFSMNMR